MFENETVSQRKFSRDAFQPMPSEPDCWRCLKGGRASCVKNENGDRREGKVLIEKSANFVTP
jgi:hypothetical protein